MRSDEKSQVGNPENPPSRIVLVPSYRYIEPETEQGLRELEARGVKVERKFGHSCVSRARSYMATWAYFSGYQRILWIDSDVSFRPADAIKLLDGGLDFVTGVYAQKNDSGMPAADVANGMAGFGFTLTSWKVLEAVSSRLPVCQQSSHEASRLIPFFQPRWYPHPTRDMPMYYGEDYSFCIESARVGFPLHFDHSIVLGHVGPYRYRLKPQAQGSGGIKI